MPKTLVCQGFSNANRVVITAAAGVVTDVSVDVEANYGTRGQQETVSIFDSLTDPQKAMLQGIFDKAITRVGQVLLG